MNQRRREQNRITQRNFRERKNKITRDLQTRVDELTKVNAKLEYEISNLRRVLGDAVAEIA